jgi:tetratricopeptide (TPR) repeat protein
LVFALISTPPYSFSSIAHDYAGSVIMVESDGNIGEAFLIDLGRKYFVTASHVVEASIRDATIPISGIDNSHSHLNLTIVDHDQGLDTALLSADASFKVDRLLPFDLYFDLVSAGTNVTFSGLAFVNNQHVHATSSTPDNFIYDDDNVILLRANTYDGDSGALLYTEQGLVVGVVQQRQMQSQAVAMPVEKLADFLSRHADGEGSERLREMFRKNGDLAELKQKLIPGRVPGAVSNLELLGAIKLLIDRGDLATVKAELVHCPLIAAALHRGLVGAVEQLEVALASLPASKHSVGISCGAATSEGSPSSTTGACSPALSSEPESTIQKSTETGKTLSLRAREYSEGGNYNVAVRLYRDAISETLSSNSGLAPISVFLDPKDSEEAAITNASIALSDVGIGNSVSNDTIRKLAREYVAASPKPEPQDDSFAAILNSYFEATRETTQVIASGTSNPSSGSRNAATSTILRVTSEWATKLANAPDVQATAYSNFADTLKAQGDLKQALASYQNLHAIRAELAKADPSSGQLERDLSESLRNIGEVQQTLNYLPEALKSYQSALAISKRLAEADPANPEWQRDLTVLLANVGEVQDRQGDFPAALASYQASLTITERLQRELPITEDESRAILATKLADIQMKISAPQRAFTWIAKTDDSEIGRQKLRLCYHKVIPGDLKPTRVQVQVSASYTTNDRKVYFTNV